MSDVELIRERDLLQAEIDQLDQKILDAESSIERLEIEKDRSLSRMDELKDELEEIEQETEDKKEWIDLYTLGIELKVRKIDTLTKQIEDSGYLPPLRTEDGHLTNKITDYFPSSCPLPRSNN